MLHLSGSIGKVTTLGAGLVAHGGMCAIWGSIRGPDDEGRELAIFCDRPSRIGSIACAIKRDRTRLDHDGRFGFGYWAGRHRPGPGPKGGEGGGRGPVSLIGAGHWNTGERC